MKRYLCLLLVCCCLGSLRAADGVEVFRSGLQAFEANGPDALLGTWFNSTERETMERIRGELLAATKPLGAVLGSEVFAPRNLGRRVQRLYGVIYFRERPLWMRAEYYAIGGREGFISLEFSTNADDILPLESGPAR